MSTCTECQSNFGCLMGKATACHKCDTDLCSNCASKNALVPFDPVDPETSDDMSKNHKVFTYCTKCFQQVSTLDFSKTYDLFEPSPKDKSNGVTFLMVHGAGGTRSMYRPHARELAKKGYRCILPDLPGHGTMVETSLSLDSCVESIQKLLKDENCEPSKTIYVGNSLGAYIGFYLLDKLGDSFAGAVLMDCGQNTGPDCSLKANMGIFLIRYMSAVMSNEGLMNAMMGIAKKSQANYHVVEAVYGSGMYFQQSSAQADILHGVKPADHIPNFKFPVAYFNGSEDHRDSEDKWLSLCKDQERSSLKVFEGGDHFFVHDSRFVDDLMDRMHEFAKAAVG